MYSITQMKKNYPVNLKAFIVAGLLYLIMWPYMLVWHTFLVTRSAYCADIFQILYLKGQCHQKYVADRHTLGTALYFCGSTGL
jgi:hypothetical protein